MHASHDFCKWFVSTGIMIQYVGIKTLEEANRINEDFIKRSKVRNKSLRFWRNVIAFLILIEIILIAAIPYLVFNTSWKIIAAAMGCVAFCAELWMFNLCGKRMKSSEDWAKPIAYQFFKLTDGRKILKTDVQLNEKKGKGDLCLKLEDQNGQISTECIRNFQLVHHPDANNVVVDLNNGVIYQPCGSEECTSGD